MHRIPTPTIYNRAYNNFAGVDFSSDHTLVNKNRLAYAVNMYKDYNSNQGQALETFAGFSKTVTIPKVQGDSVSDTLDAITSQNYIICEDSVFEVTSLVIGEETLIDSEWTIDSTNDKKINLNVARSGAVSITYYKAEPQTVHKIFEFRYNYDNQVLGVYGQNHVALIHAGNNLYEWINYPSAKVFTASDSIFTSMSDSKSNFFIFNNICYINDGINYLETYIDYSDGVKLACKAVVGYVPTTYINRIPAQTNLVSVGTRRDQRNILSPYFTNTFIAPTPSAFTLNMAIADYTCVGITSVATSTETQAPTTSLKQVETLTVNSADVITTAGNLILTVSSYLFNSDEIIYVPVVLSDDANAIAVAIKLALKNNSIVSTYYDISGINNDVVMTAKELANIVTNYQLSEEDLDSGITRVVTDTQTLDADESVTVDYYITAITSITVGGAALNSSVYDIHSGNNFQIDFTSAQTGKTVIVYTTPDNVTVTVYGTEKKYSADYTFNPTTGVVTFVTAPTRPEDNSYAVDYAGVEITAKKQQYYWISDSQESIYTLISHCTINCVFDNRVFFSGNPEYPNEVWHTMVNDPTYVGELCFFLDGHGISSIKKVMPIVDSLAVLKSDTQQDSTIYYHTPTDTEDDYNPRIYPSTGGNSGLGCIGDGINFLDDPVFISKKGLEAIGSLSIKLERAIEHRSSMVDGKFINEDLENCLLAEWNGYLICCVDGKFYMADSRQVFVNLLGQKEYEWYYIEGIGVYQDQYLRYDFSTELPSYLDGLTINDKELKIIDSEYWTTPANYPDDNGLPTRDILTGYVDIGTAEEPNVIAFNYVAIETTIDTLTITDYYLVEAKTDYIGGVLQKATAITAIDSNLFFGTENGYVCSFHFDKRVNGEIPSIYYHFDNRTIISGAATVFDNCDSPNMLKTTVKKSLVIKTKTLSVSGLKVKVRTNKSGFRLIGSINSGMFDFSDVDFSDLTFNTSDQQIFMVNEHEKKWVEKQYFIYNDELMKPFALYYLIHQFSIVGRVK